MVISTYSTPRGALKGTCKGYYKEFRVLEFRVFEADICTISGSVLG